MAPTSGGQYHWVSIMSPRFLGFVTGWLTLTGTAIQGLIVLTNPSYLGYMKNWHGTLLFWAVLLLGYAINTALSSLLAKFEGMVLVFHILGFFAIVFPLVFLSEHSTSVAVWDTFLNLGGWNTQGLSFCVGILGNVFAFLGGDGAIHMIEEVHNPSVTVPWSLMAGVVINGILGFAMLIATLYCMGDIDARLEENPIYLFMAIFHNAVGSRAGAATVSAFVIILAFSATTGFISSTSRVYWAFSRDKGLPGWRTLKKVSRRISLPVNCVILTATVAIILSLVNIGDSTAFNGVISISVAGLFGSYLMAASLLLYHRVTGGIRLPSLDDSLTNTIGTNLTWGPWRLPAGVGIVNNIFTCIYLLFVFFFSFWPSYSDVTHKNMNWSVLVFSVVTAFSMVYYAVWSRKSFTGPVIEIEQ